MVRATPTGLSAVIDAYGRILTGKILGQGAFGAIDAPVPPAHAPTIFDRCGNWLFVGMLILSLAAYAPSLDATLRRNGKAKRL